MEVRLASVMHAASPLALGLGSYAPQRASHLLKLSWEWWETLFLQPPKIPQGSIHCVIA